MDETLYPFDKERFEEMARLDNQARALNGRVPLPDLALQQGNHAYQVLDLACGPGSWAMNVARRFPCWSITGLDISERMIDFARVQSRANQVGNITFEVDNVLDLHKIADSSLDFVHGRLLQCFMSISAWVGFLGECRRVLRPGGVIQLVEATRPECNKEASTEFSAMAAALCARIGVSGSPDGQSFGICNQLAYFLLQAGFDVEEEQAYSVNYSVGTDAHQIWCENVSAVMRQYPEILARQGKPKAEIERIEQLCAKAISEMAEPDFCASMFLLSVVARKPE